VTVCGTLGERDPFSAGVKFPFDDGTGRIVLLLWQDVYDAIPGVERLDGGAQVEVTGRVDVYRGEIEIIPEASGVRVIVR